MSPDSNRAALGTLLAVDTLARSHGAGGLSPALVQALTADQRFASRVSLSAGQHMAGDSLPDGVVWLEERRAGLLARARKGGQS